jgi:hypothetical protein
MKIEGHKQIRCADDATTRCSRGTWTRGCGLLAAAVVQHLAHGAANDAGHVLAQVVHAFFHQAETALDFVKAAIDFVETAVEFVEATIDLIKSLLCLRLEGEQIPVDAFDLLSEKFGRAFELAHTALQIANLCLDIHRHAAPVITIDDRLRADGRSARSFEMSASSLHRAEREWLECIVSPTLR